MNASRLLVALAILGAFVAGVSMGIFVSEKPSSVQAPRGLSMSEQERLAPEKASHAISSSHVEERLGNGFAGPDLLSRVSAILGVSDENTRHREWLNLLGSLTSADAPAVRQLFRTMKAQGRRFDFEQSTFWPRWAELDGAAAIAHVTARETAALQPGLVEMVLRGWATANAHAARAWLATDSSAPFYPAAIRGYLDGLARHDLDLATRDALALNRGQEMGDLMDVLVEQVLQQRQPSGMLEWWNKLPEDANEGSARSAAIGPIVSRLMEIEPERARTWLTELAASAYRDEASIGMLAERVGEKDPAAAVAWISTLPPGGDGHYTGIGRSVRAWAAADKPNLDRWIAGLPASPLRDQATAALRDQSAVMFDVVHGSGVNRTLQIFGVGSGTTIKKLELRGGNIELDQRK